MSYITRKEKEEREKRLIVLKNFFHIFLNSLLFILKANQKNTYLKIDKRGHNILVIFNILPNRFFTIVETEHDY